jgi:hypothetical protein
VLVELHRFRDQHDLEERLRLLEQAASQPARTEWDDE